MKLFHVRKYWLWAALGYLFLTLLITYPVVFHLTTAIAGESSGDTLEFVWSMWWWKRALFDLHQSPLQISVINFPQGIEFPLLPLMSQVFLMGLPVTALASPVLAYNLVFLASFVLSGLAGYAFCVELSANKLAGFMGGLIWAFFPNKMGHALAGHLFLMNFAAFPLMALAWVRLLKTPTRAHAIWAGLSLALAATLHPIYLAYFIAPLLIALLGHALWVERRAFWTREKVRALVIAFGLSAVLVTPLLIPALMQTLKGNLSFLAERGAVGFAFDALGYLLPPPNNPFVLKTPLAALAARVATWETLHEYESIATIGWLPLLLAVIGARARWGESRVWVLLGLAGAVLALGPLLKVGGDLVHIPVDNGWHPLVIPYAFIGWLPFFQWSRTPGRLDVIVMLPVALLAAFGFNTLTRTLKPVLARLALGLACGFIVAEYLVKFPFPTIPVTAPPAVQALRADSAPLAVIDLPVPDNGVNLRSLYWQTIHQHPLVGGRVYRDIPDGQLLHEFVTHLLLDDDPVIAPAPTAEQRRAVLQALRIGWVLYDVQADADGSAHSQLTTRLGLPRLEDGDAAVFDIPRADLSPADVVWSLGPGWDPATDWGAWPARWFHDRASVYLFSGSARPARLAFNTAPGPAFHRLSVRVNGVLVAHFGIGDWGEYHTPVFQLAPGFNRLEFADDDGSITYVGDPRCAQGSPVSGPYPVVLPCDAADRAARQLSLPMANLRFIAEDEALPLTPSGATFGEALQLAGYAVPATVHPDEAAALHFVWQSVAPMSEDFTVFVHLLDPAGALVAQSDAQPVGNAYPTSAWGVGDVVAYNIALKLPADAAPGQYTVRVGIYRWPSLERLTVANVAGEPSDVLQLTTITVSP